MAGLTDSEVAEEDVVEGVLLVEELVLDEEGMLLVVGTEDDVCGLEVVDGVGGGVQDVEVV